MWLECEINEISMGKILESSISDGILIFFDGNSFTYEGFFEDYYYYKINNKCSFVLENNYSKVDLGLVNGEYKYYVSDDGEVTIDFRDNLFIVLNNKYFEKYVKYNEGNLNNSNREREILKAPFTKAIDCRGTGFYPENIKVNVSQIKYYNYVSFLKKFIEKDIIQKREHFVEIKNRFSTICLKDISGSNCYYPYEDILYTEKDIENRTNELKIYQTKDEGVYDCIVYFSNKDQEILSIKVNDNLYIHYNNVDEYFYKSIVNYEEKLSDERRISGGEDSCLSAESIEGIDNWLNK